jgi:hypothetical protein
VHQARHRRPARSHPGVQRVYVSICTRALTRNVQDCSFRLRENKEQVEKGTLASSALPVADMASLAQSMGDDDML